MKPSPSLSIPPASAEQIIWYSQREKMADTHRMNPCAYSLTPLRVGLSKRPTYFMLILIGLFIHLFLRPAFLVFSLPILPHLGSWPSRHLPFFMSVCISYIRPLFHLSLKINDQMYYSEQCLMGEWFIAIVMWAILKWGYQIIYSLHQHIQHIHELIPSSFLFHLLLIVKSLYHEANSVDWAKVSVQQI